MIMLTCLLQPALFSICAGEQLPTTGNLLFPFYLMFAGHFAPAVRWTDFKHSSVPVLGGVMWHSIEGSNMRLQHRVQQACQVLALGTSYLGISCRGHEALELGVVDGQYSKCPRHLLSWEGNFEATTP